jgi:hypothetical protein
MFNVCTSDNGDAGLGFENIGPSGNVGIISAFGLYGCTHRKNGGAGIHLIGYGGPNNVKIDRAYFVDGFNVGINAEAGLDACTACGFENNTGPGVSFNNYAMLRDCIGSTSGDRGSPQPYLAQGYLNGPISRRCSPIRLVLRRKDI